MANMKQIAAMAGVSLGTVSHVLNNSATVREPLRKKVMNAVQALGYQPSELARGLRRDKTNMIGMIIPDITNPFFPAVVRGAEDVAFSNGYRLILCNTDNDHEKELVHLNELRTYLPAGLIVIPSSFSDLTVKMESYRRSGTAVTCVDRLPKQWPGDAVTVANESGAHRATQYLLERGHKTIAAISGPIHLTNSRDRVSGLKRALREAGVTISPEYVQETSFDRQGGYAKALLLLRLLPRPTAVIAGNDMIALGVLQAIFDSGLRCPEDISLIGFDDLEFAEMIRPSLSTVSQPGYQLGSVAARLLFERIADPTLPARQIVLDTELKIRQSVAPVERAPREKGKPASGSKKSPGKRQALAAR